MILKKMLAYAYALLMMTSLTVSPVWAANGEALTDQAATNETTAESTDTDKTDAEDTEEEVSTIKEYTVFEAIRIRRDLLSDGGSYNLKDYKNLSTFLVNKSPLSVRYFTFQYDKQDAGTKAYKDLTVFEPRKVEYKKQIKLMSAHLEKEGYINMGWECDGEFYNGDMYFKMPAHDVILTPVWLKRCTIKYISGEYDDIIGKTADSITTSEGTNYFLADAGRFSRKGYAIDGWKCLNDGKVYKPGDAFKIPSEDVTFEAIWKVAAYQISISANNPSKDKETVWAEYNSEFVFPECEFENEGKTFAGWKYNKEIYQPGESFIVPALLSGSKIVISATWE